MSSSAIRGWYWVHKWTSLVSTLFLLMLCITGLPLIFYHEIDHATGYSVEPPELPGVTSKVSLDEIVSSARAKRPQDVVTFVSRDPDEPEAWFVSMAETPQSPDSSAFYMFDARTGDLLHEYPLNQGFMNFMFRLHYDMFTGLPGTLFLGFMGLLLAASLVSGTVVYGPFMRKLPFGTVRHGRSSRLKWLDLHNLLGIATLIWLLTVGVTGVINTLAIPILGVWQQTEMSEMTAKYKNEPAVQHLSSPDDAVKKALATVPGTELSFMAFPGTSFSSPHHYVAFMAGATPLTSKLLTPVLIDASTGEFIDSRSLPWYVKALLVSQPLHFGDYGGMMLKILWALLDVLAIVVLGSGVYLWIKKRNVPIEARLGALVAEGAAQ
ncbi:PepSY-associated TM helix domain-containing protein [Peristeroidobacter agariperforans]|uniref:PepSY-associated TM helix domain-containing protein n=1 Tax=Peristeroidobacter agariperforans TaxID=268404 RepID=UPI00101BF218